MRPQSYLGKRGVGTTLWVVIDDHVKVTHRLVHLFVFSIVPEPRSLQLLNLTQKLEKHLVVVLFLKHSAYGRVCMSVWLPLGALRVRVNNCMLSKSFVVLTFFGWNPSDHTLRMCTQVSLDRGGSPINLLFTFSCRVLMY